MVLVMLPGIMLIFVVGEVVLRVKGCLQTGVSICEIWL
jgi:hypothetical protein